MFPFKPPFTGDFPASHVDYRWVYHLNPISTIVGIYCTYVSIVSSTMNKIPTIHYNKNIL